MSTSKQKTEFRRQETELAGRVYDLLGKSGLKYQNLNPCKSVLICVKNDKNPKQYKFLRSLCFSVANKKHFCLWPLFLTAENAEVAEYKEFFRHGFTLF